MLLHEWSRGGGGLRAHLRLEVGDLLRLPRKDLLLPRQGSTLGVGRSELLHRRLVDDGLRPGLQLHTWGLQLHRRT